ncbi:hypothetical protein IWX46DRAFT_310076 [Phyllosticta citricarpa]|uniref:Secreted protein n=1 Tax=Phyllosticta citricarpa TaxID=55181 RepID=A0ABR1LH52_9PEZI
MPSFLYSLSIYFAFATTTPLLCAANFVSVPFTSMLRRNPARPLSGLQSSSMRSKSPANFQRHVLCTLRGSIQPPCVASRTQKTSLPRGVSPVQPSLFNLDNNVANLVLLFAAWPAPAVLRQTRTCWQPLVECRALR